MVKVRFVRVDFGEHAHTSAGHLTSVSTLCWFTDAEHLPCVTCCSAETDGVQLPSREAEGSLGRETCKE